MTERYREPPTGPTLIVLSVLTILAATLALIGIWRMITWAIL